MRQAVEGFKERITRLVEIAGSRRKFAEIAKVSNVAVGSWCDGGNAFESTLQKVAQHTGVSADWLREGIGDGARQFKIFAERVGPKDSAGRQDLTHPSRNVISETGYAGGSAGGGEAPVTAKQLKETTILQIIEDIAGDESMPAEDRLRSLKQYHRELRRRAEQKNPQVK